MILQFIEALRYLHLEPTDEDIADILWLALQIGPTPILAEEPDKLHQKSEVNIPLDIPSHTQKSAIAGNRVMPYSASKIDATEVTMPVEDILPFSAPIEPVLPNALALRRALRPLMRKVSSRTKFVIDEAQTAHRIAEAGLWLPVMRPAQEHWLEVALVVDESRSMAIWGQTIAEFQFLLERQGAFRDVRTWSLVTDDNGQNVNLRMGAKLSMLGQRTYIPGTTHTISELLDYTGRCLILVISDCVKQAWYNGTMVGVLARWGKRNPVVLVQMLPQALWTMCALGGADAARLRAKVPGQANMQLERRIASDWIDKEEIRTWLPLPTVTLEPDPLRSWARAFTGIENAWARGYVMKTRTEGTNTSRFEEESQLPPLHAEERLKRFRAIASPMARKLAGLLAATPISLPIVQRIQQTMLPNSQLKHVAEVFLSGLLEQIPTRSFVDRNYIQYDFIPGVRELLLDSQPTNESEQVLRNVSAFVKDRSDQFLDFHALLSDPYSLSPIEEVITDSNIQNIQPFAIIGAAVLRRLGGQYTTLASELEEKSNAAQAKESSYRLENKTFISYIINDTQSIQNREKITIPQNAQSKDDVNVEVMQLSVAKEHKFGERLRGFRNRLGITQKDLAIRLGLHPSTISTWERSESFPKDREKLLELAELLNLNNEEAEEFLNMSVSSYRVDISGYHDFGDLLRQFRIRENMTQQQLADKLNTPRATISDWEQDTFLPPEFDVRDVIDVLKLNGEEKKKLLSYSRNQIPIADQTTPSIKVNEEWKSILNLDRTQIRQLYEALLSAFPNRDNLRRMLSQQLSLNLETISDGQNLSETIFDLIAWAHSRTRLDELISAAQLSNPENADLRVFIEQIGLLPNPASRNLEINEEHQVLRQDEQNILIGIDKKTKSVSRKTHISSAFLSRKASELGIDLNREEAKILVCKRVIEGTYFILEQDTRKITLAIDTIERDLREVLNEISSLKQTPEALEFIKLGFITSLDAIQTHLREAYSWLYAASMMIEEKNDSKGHFEASQSLMRCGDALYQTLQMILIT